MAQKKKSREPSVNVDGALRMIPEHMRADAGKGTETISTRDCAWIGRDGELHGVPLSRFDLEVRPLDQAIAIAKAEGVVRNQPAGASRPAPKLWMEWETHKRGPKQYVDDYLLCRIAEAYHKAFFSDALKYPALDPIINAIINAHGPTGAPERYSDGALLARLRRKFNKRKDDLLSAVGAEDLPERGPKLARARRELNDLERSGIPIDRSRLDPALSGQPKRAGNM
ncbi:hypothetical protein [Methylobacterium sp. 1030]|uniref:hypothetical protein n=1 Tax=Methylobacterium sp. 1030 TaxID=3156404 RepID=UPI0033994691